MVVQMARTLPGPLPKAQIRYDLWTDEELSLLRSGKPVPGRSYWGCLQKRISCGIYKVGPNRHRFPYKAPEAVPGEIPHPNWWYRARRMREEGWRVFEIAYILGRSRHAVTVAVYPEYREKVRGYQRKYDAKLSLDPEYRKKKREAAALADKERIKLRDAARHAWRERGGIPKDLEKIYREYECL